MRIRNVTFLMLVVIGVAVLCAVSADIVMAQAPARGAAPAPAPAPARGRGPAPAARTQVHGNLLQVMRGILFPNSNVVFSSGLAMAEAANLLTIPGRLCSNGKPAPVQNADWQMFVQGLRAAGMATYKAGQSKNMDAVVEVSDTVATACMNCHDVYREKTPAQGGLAARCTK